MQNNDLTIWFYFDELYTEQEDELRKLGFVDGIYTCPCGTCDPQSVIFREFASKKDADAFSSSMEDSELFFTLFA